MARSNGSTLLKIHPYNTAWSALHKHEWSDKKVELPNRERQMYRCHKLLKSCRFVNLNICSIFTVLHINFTDLIMHNYLSNQSVFMTRCGTDSRHQYGIFGGESQTSFSRNDTRAGSEEGQLFSQAIPAREEGNLITTHKGWEIWLLTLISCYESCWYTWVDKSWQKRWRRQTLMNSK